MKKRNVKWIKDISGFGKETDYEKACQKMLQAGYDWLCENKKPNLKAHTYENVYGILEPDSKDAKNLSNSILNSVPDCSGAMHQAVMSILFFISKAGVDEWESICKIEKLGFND